MVVRNVDLVENLQSHQWEGYGCGFGRSLAFEMIQKAKSVKVPEKSQ